MIATFGPTSGAAASPASAPPSRPILHARQPRTPRASEGPFAPGRGQPLVPPTRDPVLHTGRFFRGKFYSIKGQRHIRCESLLEVHCASLLEFLSNVSQISEQPPALHFRVGGRRCRLTPDFLAHRRSGGDALVEVKPFDIAATHEMKARFAAARIAAEDRGYRFWVLTDRVANAIVVRNVDEMLAIRQRARTLMLGTSQEVEMPHLPTALATAIASGGSMPLSDLLRLLGNGPEARSELMTLLAFRLLAWDINGQLNDSTSIYLPEEIDDEELFA